MARNPEAVLEGPQKAVVVVNAAVDARLGEWADDSEGDVPASRELLRAAGTLVRSALVERDDQDSVGPERRRILDDRNLLSEEGVELRHPVALRLAVIVA